MVARDTHVTVNASKVTRCILVALCWLAHVRPPLLVQYWWCQHASIHGIRTAIFKVYQYQWYQYQWYQYGGISMVVSVSVVSVLVVSVWWYQYGGISISGISISGISISLEPPLQRGKGGLVNIVQHFCTSTRISVSQCGWLLFHLNKLPYHQPLSFTHHTSNLLKSSNFKSLCAYEC